jgi:hypothetical protein
MDTKGSKRWIRLPILSAPEDAAADSEDEG